MTGGHSLEKRKAMREQIVALLAKGLPTEVIAARVGCGYTMIRRVRDLMRQGKAP